MLVLILIALTVLAAQLRRLPLQNVFAIAFLIVVISCVAETMNAALHVFSEFAFSQFSLPPTIRQQHDRISSWSLPLIWIVAILVSRAFASKLLKRFTKNEYYGFWLIGFASLSSAVLWTFAEIVVTGKITWSLWKLLCEKFVLSLIVLVAIAPWMIRKKV